MSDRAKKITRRRDSNPVKISSNFVVSWYPSGIPGQGKRLQKRRKDAAAAAEFAHEKAAEIARHRSVGPLGHTAFGDLFRAPACPRQPFENDKTPRHAHVGPAPPANHEDHKAARASG